MLSKEELIKEAKKLPFILPFPLEWTIENYPEQFKEWLEWVKDKEPTPGPVALAKAEFCLVEHLWQGPTHIRAVPRREWHLLIDDGKKTIRDFKIITDNPLYTLPVSATYEGRISKKWLGYEGELEPLELWNPNKELKSHITVLAMGTLDLTTEVFDERERLILNIPKGPFKGRYVLEQEEKDSPFYVLGEYVEASMEVLIKGKFVYDAHYLNEKPHYDLRVLIENEKEIREFSGMSEDLLEKGIEEPVVAVYRLCPDLDWMNPEFKEGTRMVGAMETYVRRIDQGDIEFINLGDIFCSFFLKGTKLDGYFVARKVSPTKWELMKAALPALAKEGDPRTGKFYNPFRIEQKRGWDYFKVKVYDSRQFTRAEPEEMVEEYLPELKIPEGVKVLIGLYPVLGKAHHVRVMEVHFPLAWSKEEAIDWIKDNKLHKWTRERIIKR